MLNADNYYIETLASSFHFYFLEVMLHLSNHGEKTSEGI